MIRLYRFRFSTNVERVTLALAYKALEAESVWVDPDDRSVVERVSGQKLVPVIEDDGQVVFDSTAILHYVEERHPEPRLFPRDDARRAELDVYLDWFNRVCKRPPNDLETELLSGQANEERIAGLGAAMSANLDFHEPTAGGARLSVRGRLLSCRLRRLPVPQVRIGTRS